MGSLSMFAKLTDEANACCKSDIPMDPRRLKRLVRYMVFDHRERDFSKVVYADIAWINSRMIRNDARFEGRTLKGKRK